MGKEIRGIKQPQLKRIVFVDIKQKKSCIPRKIYVKNNASLEEIDNVQIVWSNFRNCYKLIQKEDI